LNRVECNVSGCCRIKGEMDKLREGKGDCGKAEFFLLKKTSNLSEDKPALTWMLLSSSGAVTSCPILFETFAGYLRLARSASIIQTPPAFNPLKEMVKVHKSAENNINISFRVDSQGSPDQRCLRI